MTQTINVRVRNLIRVGTDRVSDTEIQEAISRALLYVNQDTEQSKTIATIATANTDSLYYDDLIAFRAAAQVYVEKLNSAVSGVTPEGVPIGSVNVYQQQYLMTLASEFPQKVGFSNGIYYYKTTGGSGSGGTGGQTNLSYPNTYVLDARPDDSGFHGDSVIPPEL